MAEPTSPAQRIPKHGMEHERTRIVRAMLLGAALGVILLALGRHRESPMRSQRR